MMFDLLLLNSILLQLNSITSNTCTASSIAGCFSSIYLAWFSIAGIAAIFILAILILIYGVFQFVGRSDIRAWVRVKIFDVLMSLVLIGAFGYAASIIYTLPVGYFASLNIVPTQCTGEEYNIYSLSICDLSQFNTFASGLDTQQYYFLLLLGTVQPDFQLAAGSSTGFKVSADLNIIGTDVSFKYLGTGVDLIYGFLLANNLMLIILNSAPILFAILMALGLVARIFGVSRTFGGAMIAFAIGIGLLYPALVLLNYGFIDSGVNNVYSTAITDATTLATGATLASAPAFWAFQLIATWWNGNFSSILPLPILIYIGLIWIGLTFIPLIVLIIVDVFIIDFSQAIGERMDLLSLLVRVL